MATPDPLIQLDVDALVDVLEAKGVPLEVAQNFRNHEINGEAFLMMTDDHLKEVAPKIGDRITLQKLQRSTSGSEESANQVSML